VYGYYIEYQHCTHAYHKTQTPQEKAVERLIRAELNLVASESASQNRLLSGRSHRKTSVWKMLKQAFVAEKTREKFSCGIEFKQCMVTLLAWRTPWLLSIDVKRARRSVIGHVVYMTHALVILDFFKSISLHKAKAKMLKDGAGGGKFLLWAKCCEQYTRRVGLRNDWTVHFRRPDDKHNGIMGTVSPSEILEIRVTKVPKIPENTLLHREAKYWNEHDIHTSDGLELLLRKYPTNTIVLKFVDGAHAANGLVTIDFPAHCFEGWDTHVLRKDSFLEPPARQMLTSRRRPWLRLDLNMDLRNDKTASSSVQAVGTLVDVQGFVGHDSTPDYPRMVVAPVRLNLTKAFQNVGNLGGAQQADDDANDDGLETVFEVVGYVKRMNNRRPHTHHNPSLLDEY